MAMVTTMEQQSGEPADMSHVPEDMSAPSSRITSVSLEEQSSPRSVPSPRSPDLLSRSGPLPNPPFVFPARPIASSAPSSFSNTSVRRPRSAYEVQNGAMNFARDFPQNLNRSGAPPPLPNFSFNPSTLADDEFTLRSPPLSPQSPSSVKSIPTRPAGHRRGGSEFIGGDGIKGGGNLLSTSPTKGEMSFVPPNSQPSSGPSAGRRGHAHRRSAAISCHDLTMLASPPTPTSAPMGGSAPTSPSEEMHQLNFTTSLDTAVRSDGITPPPTSDLSTLASPPDSPPTRTTNRNRVGFSDTLEFIPRPLSMVSSDTSSTTTLRPGHSVSGSISSVVSTGAISPPAKESIPSPPAASTNKVNEVRPSTAGAILDLASQAVSESDGPQRRNSLPLSGDECNPSVEGPLTPRSLSRKYFFFGHEASSSNASPTRSRPNSSESSDRARSVLTADGEQPTPKRTSTEQRPQPCRKPSLTKKPTKKQKKVKSWAGSILSRKTRPRSQKQKALSRRSPTPPLRSYAAASEEFPSSDPEIHTKTTTLQATESSSLPTLQTNFADWKPRHIASQDDETMSPMIDLDAALGPLNTPLARDTEWEASQRGSGPIKRAMHSAAGMKGFQGPGMHYHRRAESAPEMVAFDNPRFRLHHIGSSSTMEDVFEEDEEDDWEEVKTVSHKGSTIKPSDAESPGLGIDIKVTDTEKSNDSGAESLKDEDSSMPRGLKRKDSGLSDVGLAGSSAKSERSGTSLKDVVLSEELPDVVEIADSTRRPVSSTKSTESSPTPPLRPLPKTLGPVDMQSIVLQPPFLTPTTPQSGFTSPFPSPRSPISYDAQRISTAPSSITDEQAFQSLWLGEPGPELRMSVDDVPSLTSSNSTMTRESMVNPALGNPQFRNGQRSASVSGASITRKRSSIASLTRLLNSSHGEKSKLSIEERAPASPERKERAGKGKRLSRMMQFWKQKDDSSSTQTS